MKKIRMRVGKSYVELSPIDGDLPSYNVFEHTSWDFDKNNNVMRKSSFDRKVIKLEEVISERKYGDTSHKQIVKGKDFTRSNI